MFRPLGLLATQVAPTAGPHRDSGQPWLLRPSIARFVTLPCLGYASRPNRAIDGVGTHTPLDLRPCRPLPQACAHVVLFSSDLALAYAPLVDYYGLRFQIEFNFRDAKQYWGLEDFMNITPTGVTNAANLSLFMVNVAYCLRADSHLRDADFSVLDLKADCRGSKYVEETIKMLPEKPEPVLLAKILDHVSGLGRIHATQPSFSFS